MTPSTNCINLIKKFEGLRLRPYLDSARIPTIGYGTIKYPNGKRVTMQDAPITESEAFSYLMFDVTSFSKNMNRYITTSHLSQNQYDALVSFTYNIGIGAFANSTLLRKVNHNPNDASIYNEFLKWKRAGGKVVQGLLNRRIMEAKFYFL